MVLFCISFSPKLDSFSIPDCRSRLTFYNCFFHSSLSFYLLVLHFRLWVPILGIISLFLLSGLKACYFPCLLCFYLCILSFKSLSLILLSVFAITFNGFLSFYFFSFISLSSFCVSQYIDSLSPLLSSFCSFKDLPLLSNVASYEVKLLLKNQNETKCNLSWLKLPLKVAIWDIQSWKFVAISIFILGNVVDVNFWMEVIVKLVKQNELGLLRMLNYFDLLTI